MGAELGVDEVDCSDDSKNFNKWCKITGWAANRPPARENFAVAAYRRSRNASSSSSEFYTTRTRLLFQGGENNIGSFSDSWIYSPGINSWILAMTSSHLGMRRGHSLSTLCETCVILFGGEQRGSTYIRKEVWLFDGNREKWLPLSVSPPRPSARDRHSASAVWREGSPCRCKESLFIYGGYGPSGPLRDLWELHCVDDTDEDHMGYHWKFHGNGSVYWPPRLYQHLSFTIKTDMYVIGTSPKGVWKLNTLTLTWSLYDNCCEPFSFRYKPNTGTYLINLELS